MRIANNPNKHEKIAPLARVVVAVITHLPEMGSDYHKTRFDVITQSINSLIENINILQSAYSLFVWDNGSCGELRKRLRHANLDALILSRNIGKTNALKSIMRMCPPGTILAYGDDDIEYFPNWLAPQIEILETFPNVGTVTGWPVRVTGMWGVGSTKRWIDQEAIYSGGRTIPDEWERDYCDSVGWNWDSYKTQTWIATDYRINYRGVSAYAMSQHCQFVCYPERVEHLIPWTDEAMANEADFDKAVDAAGLLRLATVERYTRHMGNVLEEKV